MSNKYQSNVRTYMARNLLWNGAGTQGAAPLGLHMLNPPVALTIDQSSADIWKKDLVVQFFDTAYLTEGWNPNANLSIKRAGLFSNFADGLVLSNIEYRLGFTVCGALFTIQPQAGTCVFTEGSNLVTGSGFNAAFPLGEGFISAQRIVSPFYTKDMFYLYVIDDTNARISNYAHTSVTTLAINLLAAVSVAGATVLGVSNLNQMYDLEIFLPVSNYVTGNNAFLYIVPFINELGLPKTFDLYTSTIDTAFAETQVTLDAMVEVEITPQ